MTEDSSKKKYSAKAYLRFIIYSCFGVFAFFINFKLPAYAFNLFDYNVAIVERNTFLVDHLTKLLQIALAPVLPYITIVFGIFGVIELFKHKERNFKSKIQTALSCTRIIGFIIIVMAVFKIGPEIIRGDTTGAFALNKIVVSFMVSIPVAAAFLPFLLDYGLVDFIGVLTRPIMRPIFKLPGRAAVISVSAFLGNFSLGHIAINEEYQAGKMTNQECQIIGTCLSTVSIGFLILIGNNTGIMDRWNVFFWTTFLITLLVTVIVIRLFPLNRVPKDFMEGVEPNPEQEFSGKLFSNAINTALSTAQNAQTYPQRFVNIMKSTGYILTSASAVTVFFATAGLIIKNYTPIITYVGYVFYPLFRLFGLSGAEASNAGVASVLSFIDVTLPSLTVAAGEWSLRVRYMISVIPVSSIIFLGSFIPTIMATKVPVKFGELCLIWLERVILTIIITGIFAVILF